MAQLAIRPGLPVAPAGRDLDLGCDADKRGRPHVILVIGSTVPGARALYSATWLGRRLGARVLVVAAVEYPPPRDEWVDALVAAARRTVSATAARLARDAVKTEGIVVAVPNGLGGAMIDDLADRHEAELVAVTSSRPSWFRVFPGSGLGHQLTRTGHRPVLVIPDRRAGLAARFLAWLDTRLDWSHRGVSWHASR